MVNLKAKKLIFLIIQLILLVIIGISIYKIGDYFYQRYSSNKDYSEISDQVGQIIEDSQEEYDIHTNNPTSKENPNNDLMTYLTSINEDIVGYLSVNETSIEYPIAQGQDNAYYMWRGIDEEPNVQGTIFMNYRNSADFSDKNIVIYGHLMQRGDMFNPLKNFYDQDYSNESPKSLRIYTNNGTLNARIFSIMEVMATAHDDILFPRDVDWPSHLYYIRTNSATDFGYHEDFGQDDRIISLSTCVENYDDDYRTVVFAVVE